VVQHATCDIQRRPLAALFSLLVTLSVQRIPPPSPSPSAPSASSLLVAAGGSTGPGWGWRRRGVSPQPAAPCKRRRTSSFGSATGSRRMEVRGSTRALGWCHCCCRWRRRARSWAMQAQQACLAESLTAGAWRRLAAMASCHHRGAGDRPSSGGLDLHCLVCPVVEVEPRHRVVVVMPVVADSPLLHPCSSLLGSVGSSRRLSTSFHISNPSPANQRRLRASFPSRRRGHGPRRAFPFL
jgi:hypothetical protein